MTWSAVPHLASLGTTVFAQYSALALATGSINLGQGFPDTDGPLWIREAASRAILEGRGNQYPPSSGILELRSAIASHQKRWYDLEYDPNTEVLVTTGATEALAGALIALVDTGDEVIALEPFYDSYRAVIAMARGRIVPVTLAGPDYALDVDALTNAVTKRTKILLINSPHNPTGAVLSRAESEAIARVAIEHDLIVISDEVYEHMAFDREHISLASLPGMRERTLTISSAGKLFSLTGWKIGWVTGPADLITAARTVKQFLTFANGGPFQYAIAEALDGGDSWLRELRSTLKNSRDQLCDGLRALGVEVHQPKGTYFATIDVRSLGYATADSFCQELPGRAGVVAIPSHVFYADPSRGAPYARFAFCKKPEVLDLALMRLKAGFGK
ncbi:putative N-succinyldiaminopimelate aminotransferase DapC [mine drainage metagenome]|uniref:Putative N-succinyldiaminopimelate aminotransferase DapC n=1 Tax=mine drainage metagenome TaxID=410659 RepID=A0A1J5Q698_9ZZZZ